VVNIPKEKTKEDVEKKKKAAESEKIEVESEGIEEVEETPEEKVKEIPAQQREELTEWVPKTKLGKEIVAGKYKDIKDVLMAGEIILEPEIVDYLVPDLKQELIYIGGTPGKGGGIRRTPTKMTARMHKSGRRYKVSAMVVVGNENGVVGVGKAKSVEHRIAIEKALQQAKLNVIYVKRGCGSWECNCGRDHSIPFKVTGKCGSVRIMLLPSPKGVGIVAGDESKKILGLAGIKDVWIKTFGQTATRINLAAAVFDALKNLSQTKGDL